MWVSDEEGNLINLDEVKTISVAEIEEKEEGGPTHALLAAYYDESSVWLTSGTEEECTARRDIIGMGILI